MKTRELELKDAEYMLEWMKDEGTKKVFKFNFNNMTLQDTQNFIINSREDNTNCHLAVVDENDEYLGTVSLKNIDYENMNAEYAISLRKKAFGKGASSLATSEILKKAFYDLGLKRVYLNVLSDNLRAISFYEKFGFIYEGEFKEHIFINNTLKNIKWYRMMKQEYENKMLTNCQSGGGRII